MSDTLDILLRYPLSIIINSVLDVSAVMHDLCQLNLLSRNEVEVIKRTAMEFHHKLIAIMVLETILRGDKKDFSKLTTYLQSYSDIMYVIQYWEEICKLLLIGKDINITVNSK